MSKDESSKVAQHESVESIERDGADTPDAVNTKYTTSTVTGAFTHSQAGLFHAEGITGTGFKVAVMDTGIQPHINLKVAGGVNAFNSSTPWNSGLVSNHGTQVAGVINAQGVNNELLGIAPDADLYCVRIDDGEGGLNRTLWSAQITGISWCVSNGMDAVNCSFSSRIDNNARKVAFKAATDAGIAIFSSAGNNQPSGDSTSNTSRYPAKYPFVMANANITNGKERNPSSCIGHGLNFSNGGTKIPTTTASKNSTETSNQHYNSTGTSLASPATLGIYILYKQKYGESKDKILQRMMVNAEKLGDPYWYGAGLPKYPTSNYLNIQIRG